MEAPQYTSPLLSAAALKTLPTDSYILLDVRSGPQAAELYNKGHLPNALHVDLDKDLSQKPIDAANGGRHPLPTLSSFGQLLGKLGVQPSSKVIVYDQQGGANAAARLWWMLSAVGHASVFVLDGGIQAAVAAGIPLVTETPKSTPVMPYPVTEWLLPTAPISQIAAVNTQPDYLIIDVRDSYRYKGESEPIDLIAGHIPGAVNIPYSSNMDQQFRFLPKEALADHYLSIIGDRPMDHVIVHCGSGVTACHTLLALEHAGLSGARLYVGSWSEWSRNERPIATGDQP